MTCNISPLIFRHEYRSQVLYCGPTLLSACHVYPRLHYTAIMGTAIIHVKPWLRQREEKLGFLIVGKTFLFPPRDIYLVPDLRQQTPLD